MIGDLHIHTRHSDSSNSVHEALIEAKLHGLSYVSIADHDTTDGLAEAIRLGGALDLTVIPGVEISAFDFKAGKKVHILGYGFRLPARRITELCRPMLERRHENTLRQIHRLQELGYDLAVGDVLEAARGPGAAVDLNPAGHAASDGNTAQPGAMRWPENPALYKRHIMAVLKAKGYTDSIYSELYRSLFKGDGPCAADIEYVDVFDAVSAVIADGGIAVLAHPGQQDTYHLIEDLVSIGLGGIELYHEDNDREDHRRIRDAAERFGLIMTGGSDDHGDFGSSRLLGEIVAPQGALAQLTTRNDTEIAWAESLVRQAGELARRAVLTDIEAKLKDENIRDLVTEHDRAIDRFLTESIRERHPGHGFITEEYDHPPVSEDMPVWIIDPIDGTTNFVSARGYFAVSVAHYVDGRPVFGIVYDVMADDLYLGISGEGAYLNGRRLTGWTDSKQITDCVVEASSAATSRLQRWYGADPAVLARGVRALRSFGCASLGICRIARGTLDVYISSSLSIWDYAAAIIVLEEVGGVANLLSPPKAPSREGIFHLDRRAVIATGDKGTLRQLIELYLPGVGESISSLTKR